MKGVQFMKMVIIPTPFIRLGCTGVLQDHILYLMSPPICWGMQGWGDWEY